MNLYFLEYNEDEDRSRDVLRFCDKHKVYQLVSGQWQTPRERLPATSSREVAAGEGKVARAKTLYRAVTVEFVGAGEGKVARVTSKGTSEILHTTSEESHAAVSGSGSSTVPISARGKKDAKEKEKKAA